MNMSLKPAGLAFVLTFALTAALAPGAHAEQPPLFSEYGEHEDYFSERVPAPARAFEVTLGSGYTQGFGMLQSGVGMPSVATPGLLVDGSAGYRLSPKWSFAATGQFQELTAERATTARGLTAGAAAAYHFAPYRTMDPWVQLGTGYRMLWEAQHGTATTLTHGLELGKAVAGVDFHMVDGAAIGPVVGADLDLFLWQDHGGTSAIRDPRLSTFVFVGLQARLDLFGDMVNAPQLIAH